MSAPRPILVEKRAEALNAIKVRLGRILSEIETAIVDLSKPHVDNKVLAKKLLSNAKSVKRALVKVA